MRYLDRQWFPKLCAVRRVGRRDYTGNNYALLRARSSNVGPWELFDICHATTAGFWYIKSRDNGKFVSAEIGNTGDHYAMLRARASSVGSWDSSPYDAPTTVSPSCRRPTANTSRRRWTNR